MKKLVYIVIIGAIFFAVGNAFAQKPWFPFGTGLRQGSFDENFSSTCEVAGEKFADGYIAQICFKEGHKSRCIEIFCDNGKRVNLKNLGNYPSCIGEWVNPDIKEFPPALEGSEWINPDNGNTYRVPDVKGYPPSGN